MYEPKSGISATTMKMLLSEHGELAGAIYANHAVFRNYKSGILRKQQCDNLPNNG